MMRPTALDLGAGAGGLSLGLHWAGWSTLGLELDPDAVETHRYNVGPCVHADMTTWTPSRRFALVAAGIPCQTFSHAGKRARLDDPRGRLFEHVLRICDHAQPELILLENTSSILDEGSAEVIESHFARAGLNTTSRVLDAANYEVPQHRRRWFMVATTGPSRFVWPEPSPRRVTVGEVLGAVGGYALRDPSVTWWQGNRILDANEPSPTVSTTAHEWIRVPTPEGPKLRRLDVPDLAILQSFPETNVFGRPWRWFGFKKSVYKQIGNAVPPRLGLALGEALLAAIE